MGTRKRAGKAQIGAARTTQNIYEVGCFGKTTNFTTKNVESHSFLLNICLYSAEKLVDRLIGMIFTV